MKLYTAYKKQKHEEEVIQDVKEEIGTENSFIIICEKREKNSLIKSLFSVLTAVLLLAGMVTVVILVYSAICKP